MGSFFLLLFFLSFKSITFPALVQSWTIDVSSVVSTPWRCGVVTTKGGKAGIWLGHLLGREHDSTLQSGVEAPRVLKTEPSRGAIPMTTRHHGLINCAREPSVANNCGPSSAPKTPLRAGHSTSKRTECENAVKNCEKNTSRHRHLRVRRTWTRNQPQDRSSPSQRENA